METFRTHRLFVFLLLFHLSGFALNHNSVKAQDARTNDAVVPLHRLTSTWSEGDLAGLYAFDPKDDFADNLEVVEGFLSYHFQSHPSLTLPTTALSTDHVDNPKKLILLQQGLETLQSGNTDYRTVKFVEIRFSSIGEFQRFVSNPATLKRLPNLNFILFRFSAQTGLADIASNLGNASLMDYQVFFSIDSSN